MYISARVDYATRALLALAAAGADERVKGEAVAHEQGLPVKFVENILVDLRRAGFVRSQRGSDGGYQLARAPAEITVAEVMRAIDGPLAEVRGLRPEAAAYAGSSRHLQEVWIAVRAALRSVLDEVTLADIASGELPPQVASLISVPDAWQSR